MILDVYTSDSRLTTDEFLNEVRTEMLLTEMELNGRSKLRWHVKETEQEAD